MKKGLVLFLAALMMLVGLTAYAETYDATTVYASEDSPTGYMVAFRYPDAEAERVRLLGEWGFTDHAHASRSTSLNLDPSEWQDGYFNWYTNSGCIYEMELDEETGIWSVDVPLPAGTWSYYFLTGGEGDTDDTSDAVIAYDPGNVPYSHDITAPFETKEDYVSGIYVPFDAQKQSVSYGEEAPRTDGQVGTIDYATVGDIMFTYYLPYGYDAEREEAYPVIVTVPGGGGTENSWWNKGAANTIMDNMVAEGRTEPAIIVSIDISEVGTWEVMDYVIDEVMPYMEANFNVSTDREKRAWTGASMGGHTTGMALAYQYDKFAYFGVLSNGAFSVRTDDFDFTEMKELGTTIFLGAGMYDYAYLGRNTLEAASDAHSSLLSNLSILQDHLAENDMPFTTQLVEGGHAWSTWKANFVYMLENVFWK